MIAPHGDQKRKKRMQGNAKNDSGRSCKTDPTDHRNYNPRSTKTTSSEKANNTAVFATQIVRCCNKCPRSHWKWLPALGFKVFSHRSRFNHNQKKMSTPKKCNPTVHHINTNSNQNRITNWTKNRSSCWSKIGNHFGQKTEQRTDQKPNDMTPSKNTLPAILGDSARQMPRESFICGSGQGQSTTTRDPPQLFFIFVFFKANFKMCLKFLLT